MDVYVVAGTLFSFFVLPSISEQMLKESVFRWGTAGACCKSLQHQQPHELQPHGSPDPGLLGGFQSTVVTTHRPRVHRDQRDGKAGTGVGKRNRDIGIVLNAPECKQPWLAGRAVRFFFAVLLLLLQGCEIRLTT